MLGETMSRVSRRKALNHELKNVYDLFDSRVHYVVPRYQRGYAWTTEQVGMLLDDLEEAFSNSRDEEYLLGQIIVCPSEDEDRHLDRRYVQWDLIDGQQRCTTLYLLLLAFYKKLKITKSDDGAAPPREVSELHVLTTHNLSSGKEWPKIRPASNGIEYLSALVNDEITPEVEGPTAANLMSAWSQITEFLDNFPPDEFEDFLEFFQQQVVLIRLELDESKHALRVFSKVNNRGLTLDDSDLIKNYLFQTVTSNDEFEKLAAHWDEASNILYDSRLKKTQTMDFLLKLKAGIETGKSISSSRIFDTWTENLKTEDLVKSFAKQLPIDAKTVRDLTRNEVRLTGGYSDWNYFTGLRKVVQHFEVLLAGSELNKDSYGYLNRLVQDRAVLAVLSKTEKEFERLVHPWAHNLKDLKGEVSKALILEATKEADVLDGLDELFETAFLKIMALRYSTQSHQETLRYLLARASKKVQDSIDSRDSELKSYMQTTSTKRNSQKGFDLDHIFPKSPTQFSNEWKYPSEWSSMSDDAKASSQAKWIHSIGNLVLLHPRDNRDQSDALPWSTEKLENFEKSELYLNRLTTEDGWKNFNQAETETLESVSLDAMPTLDVWDGAAVESRAKLIWSLIESDMRDSFK
jgi:uncharacterized protein with ParB-like and HNH nuclease domain